MSNGNWLPGYCQLGLVRSDLNRSRPSESDTAEPVASNTRLTSGIRVTGSHDILDER